MARPDVLGKIVQEIDQHETRTSGEFSSSPHATITLCLMKGNALRRILRENDPNKRCKSLWKQTFQIFRTGAQAAVSHLHPTDVLRLHACHGFARVCAEDFRRMEEGIVIGRVALNTAFQHLHSFPDSMEDTMTIMQNIRDSIAAWGTSKPRSVFVSEDSKHHQDSGPASSPKSLKSEASDDFEAEEHGFFPLDDEAYSSDFSIDEGDEGDTGADSTLSSLQSNDPGILSASLSSLHLPSSTASVASRPDIPRPKFTPIPVLQQVAVSTRKTFRRALMQAARKKPSEAEEEEKAKDAQAASFLGKAMGAAKEQGLFGVSKAIKIVRKQRAKREAKGAALEQVEMMLSLMPGPKEDIDVHTLGESMNIVTALHELFKLYSTSKSIGDGGGASSSPTSKSKTKQPSSHSTSALFAMAYSTQKSINIVTEEEFRRLLSDFQICPQLLQPMDVTTLLTMTAKGAAPTLTRQVPKHVLESGNKGKQLAAMYGTVSKGTALTAEEIVKATQRVFPNRINALAGKGSSPEQSKSFAHLPTPGSVFEPAYDRHGNIILDVTYPQFLDAMGRVALACYSMPPYRERYDTRKQRLEGFFKEHMKLHDSQQWFEKVSSSKARKKARLKLTNPQEPCVTAAPGFVLKSSAYKVLQDKWIKSALLLLFNYYKRLSPPSGPSVLFDEIATMNAIMDISEVMQFCKHFGLMPSPLSHRQLTAIFRAVLHWQLNRMQRGKAGSRNGAETVSRKPVDEVIDMRSGGLYYEDWVEFFGRMAVEICLMEEQSEAADAGAQGAEVPQDQGEMVWYMFDSLGLHKPSSMAEVKEWWEKHLTRMTRKGQRESWVDRMHAGGKTATPRSPVKTSAAATPGSTEEQNEGGAAALQEPRGSPTGSKKSFGSASPKAAALRASRQKAPPSLTIRPIPAGTGGLQLPANSHKAKKPQHEKQQHAADILHVPEDYQDLLPSLPPDAPEVLYSISRGMEEAPSASLSSLTLREYGGSKEALPLVRIGEGAEEEAMASGRASTAVYTVEGSSKEGGYASEGSTGTDRM